MDLSNLIKGFLGLRYPKHDYCNDDNERCPDCQCQWAEESSDKRLNSAVDIPFDYGDREFFNSVQPPDPFSIFQQMEDRIRNFFSFHSGRMLDFPFEEEFSDDGENCRDFILHPFDRNFGGFFEDEHGHGDPSIESSLQPKNPRDLVLKPFYKDPQISVESTLQQDSDLDGALLNDRNSHDLLKEFPQQPKIGGTNWSFSKSISVRTIRGPDGTVEEHRTVRDSSGNEVTTVRKSIGDQSYTVTLHKDSEGVKEKKEDLVNLDENDISQFQEKWHSIKDNIFRAPARDLIQKSDSLAQDSPGDPYYSSIFRKLFKL